jgi:uncharacterized repeat protein (TIGR02543 family)
VTLAGQGSLTQSEYTFNGWNTHSSGIGTSYFAGSSLTVNSNITLYAQWVYVPVVELTAPRIHPTKSRAMTSDGMGFLIYLSTASAYIDSNTQLYRLYRSTSQYSGYEAIATLSANASTLVFEDKNINFVEGITYHYKVAAVYGTNETMSTNAMMIRIVSPSIVMKRSTTPTNYGYCKVNLFNENIGEKIFAGATSSSKTSIAITGIPEGTYSLWTANSTTADYTDRGNVTFLALNKYVIHILQGTVTETLDTSKWSFFTP